MKGIITSGLAAILLIGGLWFSAHTTARPLPPPAGLRPEQQACMHVVDSRGQRVKDATGKEQCLPMAELMAPPRQHPATGPGAPAHPGPAAPRTDNPASVAPGPSEKEQPEQQVIVP